ncbi:MAG: OmpA family protein [Bacteroidota bacterium]|nr:OmpA family protein [Bacteroidota bacterium]
MKTQGVFLLFFFGVSISFSQADVRRNDPDRLFSLGDFGSALPFYLEAVKKDSMNPKLNYKIGYCYLRSRSQKQLAVRFLERSIRVVSDGSDYQSPLAAFDYLADAYLLKGEFDLAALTYEKYKKILNEGKNPDPELLRKTDWKIALCKVGKDLNTIVQTPSQDSTGQTLVSGDYSSALTTNELRVNISFKDKQVNRNSYDLIYFESMFKSDTYDSIPFNSYSSDTLKPNWNESTVGTSVDGQIVLTYSVEKGNGVLQLSYLTKNKWSPPQNIDKSVNESGWESHECISADGHSLYFMSSRSGGFGGRDLYKSRKLSDGTWSSGQNLGPSINTPYDEEAPFIHPDGRTLFFSSNGHREYKVFDIYTSQLSENGIWSRPVNVGFPTDTSKIRNENFPLIADTGKEKIYRKNAEKENYQVTFLNEKGTLLNIFKGEVVDHVGKIPVNLKIVISDNETYEVCGVYFPVNGSYAVILPRGRNINISYEVEGYLFHTENIDLTKDKTYYDLNSEIKLVPVKEAATTILRNVFFDEGKSSLLPSSGIELKKVSQLLRNEPEMIISINGYKISGTKDNSKFNAKLAEERAQAVADYLIAGGVKADRLIVKGYSKSRPVKEKSSFNNTEKVQAGPEQWIELKIEKMK